MLSFFLSVLESDADKRKFTEIYEQNHVRMEQVAISLLKNQHDAEDAVQNAFVQGIRNFEKIEEIPCDELPFWIISIVKNEVRIIMRKSKRIILLEECERIEEPDTAQATYMDMVALITELPETYRAVLEMKALFGYSDKEIAKELGISQTAVSSRATRGRDLLRKIIEKEGFSI